MDDDLDDMNDFLQKFRARTEQRRAKLEQKATQSIDSVDLAHDRDEVSYPPLSPLPEETEASSLNDTDPHNQSTTMAYRRENTSPSQLDYSSDLSLECDAANPTQTQQKSDFYRAEPVVCHSSPDPITLPHYGGSSGGTGVSNNNNNIEYMDRKSPRKGSGPQNDFYQPIHQSQLQNVHPQQRQMSQQHQHQQQQQQHHESTPLQEKQIEPKTPSKPAAATVAPNNDQQLITELERKIHDLTEYRIKQLKKAVTSSGSDSRGVIEAARLLQIAKIEVCDCSVYLHTLKSGLRKKADSLGSIKLSGIEFETRSALKEALAVDGISLYFFCIASCGGEVKATELIDTDSIRRQNQKDFIQFSEVLTFADLPPDFSLSLKVYEFVNKPGHKKISERPREFAEKLGLSTPKKSRPTIEIEFNYVGNQILVQSDRKAGKKSIKQVNGSKYIKNILKYRMELRPEKLPSKSGMLHFRRLVDNGLRPDWSRFWIDLSDGRINFWKSKQDALDVKIQQPELTIELKNLCCQSVQKLTPDDDLYRQNSFVIYEIGNRRGGETDTLFQRILADRECKISKHQFAADTKDERDSWCFLLDKSVNCFREWNGEATIFSIDELKELFSLILQPKGN